MTKKPHPDDILPIELPSGLTFNMIKVEGGLLKIPDAEIHIDSFYMGEFPVTQELYKEVMSANPSKNLKEATLDKNPSLFKGKKRPVEKVSWDDLRVEEDNFLSRLKQYTGKDFRLPSENEWEYAARGGKYSQSYEYSGSDDLNQVGWYYEINDDATMAVGMLLPNELGLYDMSGNIWEWCDDKFPYSYKEVPTDGGVLIREPHEFNCIIRGGSLFFGSNSCNTSNRNHKQMSDNSHNHLGFRLCLSSRKVAI